MSQGVSKPAPTDAEYLDGYLTRLLEKDFKGKRANALVMVGPISVQQVHYLLARVRVHRSGGEVRHTFAQDRKAA